MSWPLWNTAAYWRELAVQTRKLVDDVKDAERRAFQIRVRFGGFERAQPQFRERFVDDGPHRGDVKGPIGPRGSADSIDTAM